MIYTVRINGKPFKNFNNKEEAIKHKIIKKTDKVPYDYKRDFFVYREETDIHGNPVTKEELFEGSQKRFIYWCKDVQK